MSLGPSGLGRAVRKMVFFSFCVMAVGGKSKSVKKSCLKKAREKPFCMRGTSSKRVFRGDLKAINDQLLSHLG